MASPLGTALALYPEPPSRNDTRSGGTLTSGSITALRAHDGTLVDAPDTVDSMLWESRRELWQSVPELPAVADRVIGHYIQGRAVTLPDQPQAKYQTIAKFILKVGGSAGGADGRPYE